MPSWSSEIDFTYEDDDGAKQSVTVRYWYEPGCKPRRYGHPDDWHDGSGPEIDIREMTWTATNKKLTKDEFDAVYEAYGDSIVEKIVEAEESPRD